MSADQTPAADPTPGSSRVDVARLRAAAEAVPAIRRSWAAAQGVSGHWWIEVPYVGDVAGWDYEISEEDAEHIAAADPTTVLALLDERDDLAARLATAEAEVERQQRIVMGILNERDLLVRSLKFERRRAEVAERQVQAVREVAERWVKPRPYLWRQKTMSTRYAGECILDALAQLDPDAPTGHDGRGDPDTHQGDTEAGDGR